jgi:repressor LexA
MLAGLTDRQNEIYQFLLNEREKRGICPTQEEICKHFGFKSLNSAQQHLRLLEKKGFIKLNPGKARSIQLIAQQVRTIENDIINVPLIGSIPAGNPALATECHVGVLALSRWLYRGPDLFALSVRGDSMTGAGIFDGDLAVLSAGTDWADGAIAAVVLEDEATLKRLYRTAQGLRLHPENPVYADRWISEESGLSCRVAGVLMGTIRQFN